MKIGFIHFYCKIFLILGQNIREITFHEKNFLHYYSNIRALPVHFCMYLLNFFFQLVYHDDSDELNDELDEMLLPVSDTDNEEWEQEESEGEENGVGPNESRVIDVEDSSDGEDVGEGGDNDQDQDMEDEQPIVNGVGSASEEEEMEDD